VQVLLQSALPPTVKLPTNEQVERAHKFWEEGHGNGEDDKFARDGLLMHGFRGHHMNRAAGRWGKGGNDIYNPRHLTADSPLEKLHAYYKEEGAAMAPILDYVEAGIERVIPACKAFESFPNMPSVLPMDRPESNVHTMATSCKYSCKAHIDAADGTVRPEESFGHRSLDGADDPRPAHMQSLLQTYFKVWDDVETQILFVPCFPVGRQYFYTVTGGALHNTCLSADPSSDSVLMGFGGFMKPRAWGKAIIDPKLNAEEKASVIARNHSAQRHHLDCREHCALMLHTKYPSKHYPKRYPQVNEDLYKEEYRAEMAVKKTVKESACAGRKRSRTTEDQGRDAPARKSTRSMTAAGAFLIAAVRRHTACARRVSQMYSRVTSICYMLDI
jgi:hypothetical protein